MNIKKCFRLYKIQIVELVWARAKDEQKGTLEEFWNGAHLEDEQREDREIRGCRRLH